MTGRYSGAWTPDMGGDDDASSPPKRSLQEKYGDWQEERAKDKARLEIWMNGREPRQWFEEYSNKDFAREGKFFCVEFPTTNHYFVVAWERAHEWGTLYVWCFGCKRTDCGACRWTRSAYKEARKEEFKDGNATTDDLPF
jgi:hypothetical protein